MTLSKLIESLNFVLSSLDLNSNLIPFLILNLIIKKFKNKNLKKKTKNLNNI